MSKKLYTFSFVYLVLGLALGIFYREVTRGADLQGTNPLSFMHPHSLVLGFVFFLLAALLHTHWPFGKARSFTAWLIAYNLGLLGVIGTLAARGLMMLNGTDFAGLSHIAGTFHALLGISLIWFMLLLRPHIKESQK